MAATPIPARPVHDVTTAQRVEGRNAGADHNHHTALDTLTGLVLAIVLARAPLSLHPTAIAHVHEATRNDHHHEGATKDDRHGGVTRDDCHQGEAVRDDHRLQEVTTGDHHQGARRDGRHHGGVTTGVCHQGGAKRDDHHH